MRRAFVQNARDFDVATALGTAKYQLDERFTVSGGLGYAWLATKESGGVSDSAPTVRISLDYARSTPAVARRLLAVVHSVVRVRWQIFEPGVPGRPRGSARAALGVAREHRGAAGRFARRGRPFVALKLGTHERGAIWRTAGCGLKGTTLEHSRTRQYAPGQVNRARVGVQVAAATRTRIH